MEVLQLAEILFKGALLSLHCAGGLTQHQAGVTVETQHLLMTLWLKYDLFFSINKVQIKILCCKIKQTSAPNTEHLLFGFSSLTKPKVA